MEVKFIDKPKATFTTGDVRPGERFQFCGKWHRRPSRVYGPPAPFEQFWVIQEDDNLLTHLGPVGQNVEIEGRKPPESERGVRLFALRCGDMFKLIEPSCCVYQVVRMSPVGLETYMEVLELSENCQPSPKAFVSSVLVIPLKATLTVER